MKRFLLPLAFVIASLFTASAFAQKDAPSEGRTAPTAKATAKKADGKAVAASKATTKAATKTTTKAKATAPKKPGAKAERKTEAPGSTKAKKNDITGPAS